MKETSSWNRCWTANQGQTEDWTWTIKKLNIREYANRSFYGGHCSRFTTHHLSVSSSLLLRVNRKKYLVDRTWWQHKPTHSPPSRLYTPTIKMGRTQFSSEWWRKYRRTCLEDSIYQRINHSVFQQMLQVTTWLTDCRLQILIDFCQCSPCLSLFLLFSGIVMIWQQSIKLFWW